MLVMVSKIVGRGTNIDDEIACISGMTILTCILENVQGIDSYIPSILTMFLERYTLSKTPEYKVTNL
jgi:hypothetical protein